jgi:uncharacterized phiE125 gp8 family phage protein
MNFTYAAQPTGTDLISLADMKQFLRVDSSDEDITITAIIDAAAQSIQDYTGRHFKTTTFVFNLDSFHFIEFPYQVTSVSSVTYLDRNGDTQTLATNKYFSDTGRQPGRINFINFPDLVEDKFNRVQIKGGVNAIGNMYPPLVHAIKMLAAHYYENRRAVVVGATSAIEIPLGVKAIINPYRIINTR